MMQAIRRTNYGGPEVLALLAVPRPTPAADQVLVRVAAAGIDRGQWHLMTGLPKIARLALGLRRPRQPGLGMDVAGVVEAVGTAVTDFRVGDAVFGVAIASYAELAVASARKIARIPAGLAAPDAAAIPVSGTTALQAVRAAGLESGHRVLVTGASGGVGSFAVQLAAAQGAAVTATASAAKVDFVTGLGAAQTRDYALADGLSDGPFDAIIDIGGALPVAALRAALTPQGSLVLVGAEGGGAIVGTLGRQLGVAIRGPFSRQRLTALVNKELPDDMATVAQRLARGDLQSPVTARYPLPGVPTALAHLAAGRITGKAVVVVE